MGGDEEEHRVDAEDEDEGDDCLDPEDDVTRLDGNNCIFILGVTLDLPRHFQDYGTTPFLFKQRLFVMLLTNGVQRNVCLTSNRMSRYTETVKVEFSIGPFHFHLGR